MKTIKGIMSIAFIISYNLLCHAQILTPARWLAYQQNELKTSTYIFEGKVIQHTDVKETTLTCSVVQITKIYRGNPQLKLGTIKVMTTFNGKGSEKVPELYKGETCIIFGWVTKSKAFDSIVVDNPIMIQTNDWVGFTGAGASWGWRGGSHYNSLDSLYSFFRENGVTVQEEVEQKK